MGKVGKIVLIIILFLPAITCGLSLFISIPHLFHIASNYERMMMLLKGTLGVLVVLLLIKLVPNGANKVKSIIKEIGIVLSSQLILIIVAMLFWYSGCGDDIQRRYYFDRSVGEYKIYLSNKDKRIITDLGDYIEDSTVYKNLTLKMNSDSTFIFNMQAPFILDTFGTWTTGYGNEQLGLTSIRDERNNLHFKNCTYRNEFGLFNNDSMMWIQVPPKNGRKVLQWIYFKRIGQ